jgi:6-pyruvoyltetrahydropterin/6-carboxytetrahydropterin synthase
MTAIRGSTHKFFLRKNLFGLKSYFVNLNQRVILTDGFWIFRGRGREYAAAPGLAELNSELSYRVGVRAEFSAAHYHGGAAESCRRLHGHNYRVEVEIASPTLKNGMVIDFGEVRRGLGEALAGWDHRVLNEVEDFSGAEPTTEVISRLLYFRLADDLRGPAVLRRVTVWETDDCWASYGEG